MEQATRIADPNFADIISAVASAIAAQVAAQLQPPPPAPRFEWLRPAEAASYVKLSTKRLEALRRVGGGPSFERNGRRVRYTRTALDAWLRQRRDAKGPR